MPKIDVNKEVFRKLFPKTDREYLESVLPYAKAEYEDEDDTNIRIELNDTNRPDLWSTMGLARLLNGVVRKKEYRYDFFSDAKCSRDYGGRVFTVDDSRPEQRPYSIGFCVGGRKIDENVLKLLIDIQEKIHMNYGRKRRSISMGLYRSGDIKFPVIFKGADPDKNSYVPLHDDRKLTLRQILDETEKGREYGYIIKDYVKFPFLVDSAGTVLSMPPVINSADVGALQVGDSEIFIEINGVYLKQVLLVGNMLACDFADLGFKVHPVRVDFPQETPFGKSIVVPYYFQEPVKCTAKAVERLLGPGFDIPRCVKCLKRMGVTAKAGKSSFLAYPPYYRNDYLSDADVIEDIAIGFGLDNFKREELHDFTIGRLSPAEDFNRKVQKILLGFGYNEMIFNYLSSKEEYVDNMLVPDDNVIYIENPMSQNFKTVRPSVIPSLLKAESVSQSAVYPHMMFETGKVAVRDAGSKDGTVTRNSLGLLESGKTSNYNRAVSVLNTLMYYLSVDYHIEAYNDDRFIAGRSAKVFAGDAEIGVFGEISPQCLEKWQIGMPCFAMELDTDLLLSLKK